MLQRSLSIVCSVSSNISEQHWHQSSPCPNRLVSFRPRARDIDEVIDYLGRQYNERKAVVPQVSQSQATQVCRLRKSLYGLKLLECASCENTARDPRAYKRLRIEVRKVTCCIQVSYNWGSPRCNSSIYISGWLIDDTHTWPNTWNDEVMVM